MFLLRLRPAFAHYRCCCIIPCRGCYLPSCSLRFSKDGLLHSARTDYCISASTGYCISANTGYCILARTGWKPKKNLAQSNALGTVDHLFCALKEQKEGGSVATANNFVDVWVWILFSFCAYSAPVCFYIHTQGVALGCIPIGASPRLRANVISQKIFVTSPRLCSKHLLHNIQWYTPVWASIRNCV